jgi:hypothetical protein
VNVNEIDGHAAENRTTSTWRHPQSPASQPQVRALLSPRGNGFPHRPNATFLAGP